MRTGPRSIGTVDRDAAGLVERPHVAARAPCRAPDAAASPREKPLGALEPVPEERPDPHVVVVEPHLAVGQDVEPGLLLVAQTPRPVASWNASAMRDDLERLEHVASLELIAKPGRPRIRPDHRRGQDGELHGRHLATAGRPTGRSAEERRLVDPVKAASHEQGAGRGRAYQTGGDMLAVEVAVEEDQVAPIVAARDGRAGHPRRRWTA